MGALSSVLWPKTTDGISLRDELSDIVRNMEKRLGLIRRLIRDSNNKPILCQCREKGSRHTSRVHICDRCLNEGYKWVEEWIYYHKRSGMHGSARIHETEMVKQPGTIYSPLDVFYLEYRVLPTEMDSIIEVALDSEGKVVTPVIRTAFHNIKAVEEFRLDGARIEFFQCSCAQMTVGFFGQPLATRNPSTGRV